MTRQPRGDWRRVTRAELCPVCGRPDWCLVTGPEGGLTAAICARTESPKRAAAKRVGCIACLMTAGTIGDVGGA